MVAAFDTGAARLSDVRQLEIRLYVRGPGVTQSTLTETNTYSTGQLHVLVVNLRGAETFEVTVADPGFWSGDLVEF